VGSLGVVEEEPVGQFPVKEVEIRESQVFVVVDEGFLNGLVEAFGVAVPRGGEVYPRCLSACYAQADAAGGEAADPRGSPGSALSKGQAARGACTSLRRSWSSR
jgi:hypothetical protein